MKLPLVTVRGGTASTLAIAAAVALTGCAAQDADPVSSAVSFGADSISSPVPSSPATDDDSVPVATAGTVCGSVVTPAGANASVVIRAGAANCVEVLRVAATYAGAIANADGQAVTVETGGWRCTAKVTDPVATCASGTNTVTLG